MSLQAIPVSGRLPDSYYMERYNCTYDEYIARRAADYAYAEYTDPVEARLTKAVGVLYPEKYWTDVLVEKREGYVTPDGPSIRTQYQVWYSIGDTVVLMERHCWYEGGSESHTGYWVNIDLPTDIEVSDIVLLRENEVSEGYQRRIVGQDTPETYARVTLADQLDGRTRLKPELRTSYNFIDDVMQMTLDVGMGAY